MTTLPSEPSDLTAEWLTGVLDSPIESVEVVDHAATTNQRARIALTYASGHDGPSSLFVKLAPLDPVHRQMVGATGMAEREVEFYADVAGGLDLLVPACPYAAVDGDTFVLLLEDLALRGCAFSGGEWGLTADAAASGLADLARFHARFADPAARKAVAPWLATAPEASMSEGTAALMRIVLDENADALGAPYSTIGELFIERHEWFNEVWHSGPQTLIHGDTHIGNVYLDGDRVGFLDWGLSRESTPLRDVSYFLTMSVDIEERRAHEHDLLRDYLDGLRAEGGPDIAFDDAWATHRLQASYTVIATFLAYMPTYLSGDGIGLAEALLARANAALDDLDVVEAVQSAM